MKVFLILVVLVTLAVALPRSDEDEFGDWEFGVSEEELQVAIAKVGYGSGGGAEVFYDNPAMVEPVEPKGQINVDGKIEHGVWYNEETVNFLGYPHVQKDKACCEECKNLYGDTDFFQIRRESTTDFFLKQCGCLKSKPGVVPSTYSKGSMSGKCGLWEYNGDLELGKERILTGTHFLGSIHNVTDGSYCCDACMDKFPDTQLFNFNDYEHPEVGKYCICEKIETDVVPTIWEQVYGIGTCDRPVEVVTEIPGQINVDGKIEHGVWYNVDTITDLGYAYDVAKDTPCCEACKNLYDGTEFFELHRETGPDFFYKQCACVKSKPGVVKSTYSMVSISGKCGIWEYNGDVELGEERLMVVGSTHFLGRTKNVSDASDCCDACMDMFPDTQLFGFFDQFKDVKFCYCEKTKTDVVPATWEKVYGIGTCDGPVALALEIPAASTMDYQEEIEVADYNYEPFKLTREFLVRGIMDSFEAYYDTNPKDGNLTKEEFETAIQSDAQSTNLTWEDLLKLIDENCDGAIIDLEFRGLADISFEIMSLDKDENFYITQEELNDDKLWKTLLDQHADKDAYGRVDMNEYYKFMFKRYLENDRCPARPAPPSAYPLVASDKSLDKLFDDDGDESLDKLFDGGDLGDGLDKIVVTLYRIRAAGEKTYYKETAEGEMELIL